MLLSIIRTSVLYKEENIMWNYAYTVPENKKVRVIVHTDCKNEADDQYAVAHHLMTPRFDVKALLRVISGKTRSSTASLVLRRQATMRSSKSWSLWGLRINIR